MGESEPLNKKFKFIRIAVAVYVSTVIFSVIFSISPSLTSGIPIIIGIGNIVLYGGIFFFILGFMIMGSNRGLHRRETAEQYKSRRERERPIELVALAVSTGGLSLIVSGYLVLYFIALSIW